MKLQQVLEVVHRVDPMDIAMVDDDEYIEEARMILEQGENASASDMRQVVKCVFDRQFWEGCLTEEQVDAIVEGIDCGN